jgi:hypothetical protein
LDLTADVRRVVIAQLGAEPRWPRGAAHPLYYRTSGTMKTLGKGSESMPQNTSETPPCPTCGKPGTFQNSDGQCDYYLCPNGHHFYKRIGGSH